MRERIKAALCIVGLFLLIGGAGSSDGGTELGRAVFPALAGLAMLAAGAICGQKESALSPTPRKAKGKSAHETQPEPGRCGYCTTAPAGMQQERMLRNGINKDSQLPV